MEIAIPIVLCLVVVLAAVVVGVAAAARNIGQCRASVENAPVKTLRLSDEERS